MDLALSTLCTVEQWKRLALLLISCLLLIPFGVSLIVFGATETRSWPDPAGGNETFTSTEVIEDFYECLIAGCWCSVIGFGGFVAVLFRIRALLFVVCSISLSYVALDAERLSSNAIVLSRQRIPNKILLLEEHVMLTYGSNDSYSLEQAENIDEIQAREKCCGWSLDPGENVFAHSPWYEFVNSNTSEQKPMTLPESCCPEVSDECVRATDVKKAKESGVIYKMHCLEALHRRDKLSHMLRNLKYTVLYVFQIPFIILSLQYWKQEKESVD